jgi:molybdopterin converting factor small subunit
VISVEINMHGDLRRFLPDGVSSTQLDLPEGTTVLRVIDYLQAEHEVWLASIDNKVVPLSAQLSDGCSLAFFPLLESGQAWSRLTEAPDISSDDLDGARRHSRDPALR